VAILHINTEDVHVTRLIYDTGKSLGIDVYNHLVFGQNRFAQVRKG
jgi:DNA repair protein RadC